MDDKGKDKPAFWRAVTSEKGKPSVPREARFSFRKRRAVLPPRAVPPENAVICFTTLWLQLSPVSRRHDPHLEGSLAWLRNWSLSIRPLIPPGPCSFLMKEPAAATGLWCGQAPLPPPNSCGSRTLTSSRPGGRSNTPVCKTKPGSEAFASERTF